MSNTARMSAKAPVILGPFPGSWHNMCLVWRAVKAKAVCGRIDGSSLDSRSHQTPEHLAFRGMIVRQHVSSIILNLGAGFSRHQSEFGWASFIMPRCAKPAGDLQRLEGSEMVSDVGDSEGGAGHPFTDVEVRAQLIKYLADSLRDFPGERRTFLYFGRVLAGTEWSRWMQYLSRSPSRRGVPHFDSHISFIRLGSGMQKYCGIAYWNFGEFGGGTAQSRTSQRSRSTRWSGGRQRATN